MLRVCSLVRTGSAVLLLSAPIVAIAACNTGKTKPLSAQSTGSENGPVPGSTRAEVERFGAPLGQSPQQPLASVLSTPAAFEGQTVQVAGLVRRACSAKGCWMELATGLDKQAAGCRVTFKDYGFFVPTDSAGAQARVEGEVRLKRVPATQVKHYEGEGAVFPAKHEDGSADEVRLVATGVELQR